MVVMTAKVSKAKLILAVVLVLAVIVFAAVYLHGSSGAETEQTASTSEIHTNDQRIAFLNTYGWEVSEKPVETEAVMIPEEMDDVLLQYNKLQKSQGFDLSEHTGKQVKRYVYEVTNYTGTEAPVYATLLIWQGNVIGGDITLTEKNGRMHGFSKPNVSEQQGKQTESPEQSEETPSEESAVTPESPTV